MVKKSVIILFLLIFGKVFSQESLPKDHWYVNDFAQVLSPQEIGLLNNQIKDFEDSTGVEIAVVIEKSLNGSNEFDRAMKYAREWGVGKKNQRNGVVVYLAIEDRKIFITTADKTQGVLNDGRIGEIIRKDIAPYFKENNYFLGISNGLNSLFYYLQNEFKKEQEPIKPINLFVLFLMILFIIILIRKMNKMQMDRGLPRTINRRGATWFPTNFPSSGGSGGGWSGGGSTWGGFGGGGGFNGGGAGGSW